MSAVLAAETPKSPVARVLRLAAGGKTLAIGVVVTGLFVLLALFAPLLAPYPPAKTDYAHRLAAPSAAHLLGSDMHGRDILSRLLYGSQVSLRVGLFSVLLASLVGMPIGLTTGFFGGRYDVIISRLTDALFAFPSILWAIAIVAVLGPSEASATLAIALPRIPVTVRLARAAIISEKEHDYVEASRALGSSPAYVIFRAILPNIAGSLLVLTSLGFAVAILTEAGLSYLGLSVQAPQPSWGNMLQESQRYLSEAPWFAFFSGLTIFFVVLGLNLLGDGMRDLFDPRRGR